MAGSKWASSVCGVNGFKIGVVRSLPLAARCSAMELTRLAGMCNWADMSVAFEFLFGKRIHRMMIELGG